MKKPDSKRQRFVEEYLIDLNATKAAKRSGYSKKTAYSQGQRLLKNVEIQKAIAREQAKRSARLEITADMWLRELWIIGHSNIQNYINIDEGGLIIAKTFEEMPSDTSRALEAIEENRTIKESADGKDSNVLNSKIKFKMHSKTAALDMIGKHLGFYEKDNSQRPGIPAELTIKVIHVKAIDPGNGGNGDGKK